MGWIPDSYPQSYEIAVLIYEESFEFELRPSAGGGESGVGLWSWFCVGASWWPLGGISGALGALLLALGGGSAPVGIGE
eukprot:COSAG02_NODE_2713_length_8180_cov_268.374706_1_plen_79_part_00